ncbi:MAG: VOC family protein [Treponema sp.]|nr:VOC family protein [Treponema sp.]
MIFNGFHHIGLLVQDAEKSKDFYVNGLGGKEIFSFPMGDSGKSIYLVDLGGNSVLEIIPRGNGEEEANARWAHIALRTDDSKAAYDMAMKAGAQTRMEPRETNLGTMAVTISFVYGPDKEVIEFFQVM